MMYWLLPFKGRGRVQHAKHGTTEGSVWKKNASIYLHHIPRQVNQECLNRLFRNIGQCVLVLLNLLDIRSFFLAGLKINYRKMIRTNHNSIRTNNFSVVQE